MLAELEKKNRVFPQKPEWKIILDNLVFQEHDTLFRICRKMIIYLDRMEVTEILQFIENLNPSIVTQRDNISNQENSPKPKGSLFNPVEVIADVFSIADKYLADEVITELLKEWIYQESVNFMNIVLEKRHAQMFEVVDAVRKFLRIISNKKDFSINEIMGHRVGLIQRLLSENLNYINIAKHYIKIRDIGEILDNIVGPVHGSGKLGGKSAGLILAKQILDNKKQDNENLQNINVPKSWFITSDTVLEFAHYNALEEFVFTKYQTNEEIEQEYPFLEYIFKNSHFPPDILQSFNSILDDLEGAPIVIRSSSLLEDSFEAAFSGKYKSLFIANVGTKEQRLNALTNAIAEVFASTFSPDPIEYRKQRGLLDFREEMGILIQQVVGNQIGKYFLPSFAGVAFSLNEFRWSPRINRNDGVLRVVAGLGTRAVDRTINDYPKLISPGQPHIRVNYNPNELILYSQQYIDVINLETENFETIKFNDIIKECKGNYPAIEKIVSFNRQGTLVEPISALSDFENEELIITFNNLVNNSGFIPQIKAILKELQEAYNSPVDIEFAFDGTKLYLLQCRPQSQFEKENLVRVPGGIPSENIVFTANQFVSNGLVHKIKYLVYVDYNEYSMLGTITEMKETAKIIGVLNRLLPEREFVLIGPGRWGSKGDIKLGVPVIYSDINNAALLIEVAFEKAGFVPELSFGTHFFQDLVESNIKYLPLYPDKKDNIFNIEMLLNTKNHLAEYLPEFREYSKVIKLVKAEDIRKNGELNIYMDGELGKAVGAIEKR